MQVLYILTLYMLKKIALERALEKCIETICIEMSATIEYIRDNSNVTKDNVDFYDNGVYPCMEEVLLTLIRIKQFIKQAENIRLKK